MVSENKYGKNNKTDIILKFCEHLRNGYSRECFVDFDYNDVHKMAEETDSDNNNTNCMEMIERGYREYKYFWEKQGIKNMNIVTGKDAEGNDIIKFDRGLWMFMFKMKREVNSGQAEIPFEGINVIRLKSNS